MGEQILSKSSCASAFALGFSKGFVVIWNMTVSKEVVQFEVTPKDLDALEPSTVSGYSDLDLKPKKAWVMASEHEKIISTGTKLNTKHAY
jgi:hypothetical protein